MASKAAATDGAPETRKPAAEAPLLDAVAATITKMLARGREQGYLTYDELNAALPPDQVSSEQTEDTMAMLSEQGVAVIESEEGEEPADGEVRGNLDKDDIGRTDDPVRMYLRTMRSVELLSREGEVAIAKRIEAGREMMIGGICESPLTIRAIIGWRDALNEGKMLLRDIIDLNVTYGAGGFEQTSPTAAVPAESDTETAGEDAPVEVGAIETEPEEAEIEESSISLAAMEAQLKPSVLAIFDAIAEIHEELCKLQDQRIAALAKGRILPRLAERRYEKLKRQVVDQIKRIRLHSTRLEHLVEQLDELSRRLVTDEGKLLRLAEDVGVKRPEFLQQYFGDELAANWLERIGNLSGRGWPRLVEKHSTEVTKLRAGIAQIAAEAKLPIAELRHVVQTVQRGEREAARAKKEMIEANLRLVTSIAKKYANRGSSST